MAPSRMLPCHWPIRPGVAGEEPVQGWVVRDSGGHSVPTQPSWCFRPREEEALTKSKNAPTAHSGRSLGVLSPQTCVRPPGRTMEASTTRKSRGPPIQPLPDPELPLCLPI